MGKEYIHKLLSHKMNISDSPINSVVETIFKKNGMDAADLKNLDYTYTPTDAKKIYDMIMEVIYDLLNNQSAFILFRTDDTSTILKGNWTEEKTHKMPAGLPTTNKDNKNNVTVIQPFLQIKTSSKAPANKKSKQTTKSLDKSDKKKKKKK